MERDLVMSRVARCLNTEDGKLLMDELAAECNGPLMGKSNQETGYLVGKFEIYRLMLLLQERKYE